MGKKEKKKINWFVSKLLIWGKPFIKSALRKILVPILQKVINGGAIDDVVDRKIAEGVELFIKKNL